MPIVGGGGKIIVICTHSYCTRSDIRTLHFPLNKASTLLTGQSADTSTSDDGSMSILSSWESSSSISVSPTNRSWPQFESNSTCTVIGCLWLRPLLDCWTAPLRLWLLLTLVLVGWTDVVDSKPRCGEGLLWVTADRWLTGDWSRLTIADWSSCVDSLVMDCFTDSHFKFPADKLFLTSVTHLLSLTSVLHANDV